MKWRFRQFAATKFVLTVRQLC